MRSVLSETVWNESSKVWNSIRLNVSLPLRETVFHVRGLTVFVLKTSLSNSLDLNIILNRQNEF